LEGAKGALGQIKANQIVAEGDEEGEKSQCTVVVFQAED
jgi:hypothetical protein